MGNPEEAIQRAEAAVDEAKSSYGEADVRVSYKLDELSLLLKESGRLLEAANAAAKAKAIRTATHAKESDEQSNKFGDLPDNSQRMSATAWLWKLHRWALVASLGIFAIILLIPASGMAAGITKNVAGSTMFGVFLQLLMFPIKSLPRITKWIIVAVGTGIVGMVLFR
jgi:hypothetical protein